MARSRRFILKATLGLGLLGGLVLPMEDIQAASSKGKIAPAPARFQAGDILFVSSTSGQGRAIQLATKSKFTHMGIVLKHNGKLMVFHAVEPVKKDTIQGFLAYSEDGSFEQLRLKDPSVLSEKALEKMTALAIGHLGKPYDLAFGWDDSRLYCSEYVWKLYQQTLGLELGELKPLGSFDLTHPAVQAKLKERYGEHIPLQEKMIAPGDMHASPLLTPIHP